jgi:response regulator RpfG family c-di-GMP phosphodiesterase
MRRLSLLLLVAFVAACGGGNDDDEAGKVLTRAEYTRLANASCVTAEKKLNDLGGFENFAELEKEMKVGRDALQQSADELRALKPPAQLAARHREFIDLTEETADVATRISAAAGKNDQVEMQKQAERAEEITQAANDVAEKLGLQECVAG